MVNAEGDTPEFCAAVSAKPFEAEQGGESGARRFAWLEQAPEGPRRPYSSIQIRHGKLRLECNSRKRLAIGRQLLEKHGGRWLRHLGDSFESLDAVKRQASEPKPAGKTKPGSGLPPEVEREIVLRAKTERYRRWVDERLPALDGRTPREAARSETGRRALEDLLRDIENGEERQRLEGGAAFDFSEVRKTLGM